MIEVPNDEFDFNNETKYLNILGTKTFPKSPEEFPPTIDLPSEISQVLHEAREKTASSGNEVSVNIFTERNQFRYEHIEGIEGTVGEPYKDLARIFFGEKPLINYHVHRIGNNPFLSLRDMSIFSSTPRGAYMYSVGTDAGYWVLAQSQKALKLPISYYGKRFTTSFSIQERIAGESRRSKEDDISQDGEYIRMLKSTIYSLENYGLALYFDSFLQMKKRSDPLAIKLTRFRPDDIVFRLTAEQRQSIFS